MKIVVIGGTGLIGTRVVERLGVLGHDAVAASRRTGVNAYTGEGLSEALDGADVVVDTSTSPYTQEREALDYFETETLNLTSYGRNAGVRHHVAISVVGTDRLARAEGQYFEAKRQQETLIEQGLLPYSIVHSTQFFEFLGDIANSAATGRRIALARAFIQPIAADDAAQAVVDAALGAPTGRTTEHAGPEAFRLSDIVARSFQLSGDPREVVADPLGRYFGARIGERDLLPGEGAVLAATRFEDWLAAATLG